MLCCLREFLRNSAFISYIHWSKVVTSPIKIRILTCLDRGPLCLTGYFSESIIEERRDIRASS
ncbi:unnamed protein product [Moneuplotes crassus]|uniref:Uncharacterized protein n=1 Tax=Euplotes crassus TaxID=5936 RepID=A0AAD2D5J7_EUPCR|nr:unnamed protein product [Moneuplotes crassus]